MTWRPYRWDDYEIELVDSSLVTIGHLDEAHMLAYDWASFGHGKAVAALHKDSQQALTLLGEEQFYIKVFRAGRQVRDFMVSKDDHGYTVDDFNVDEYVKLIFSPLEMFLAQDFCQPETAAGLFATPSLAIDDAFKWIVDHVMGPNAYDSPDAANRTRTGLTIAANLGDHPTTQVIDVCDRMNLFEFLQRFGPNWSVDWRVRLEITAGKQNQMVFETFYPRRGLDKTELNHVTRQPVLINDASINVPRARKFRSTAGMVNVWVAEDLSGETVDAASVAAWGRHAALAATSASDKLDTLITNKGIEEGQEHGFTPSEQCQLGEDDDFVPGDLVTVGNAHVGIDASDQPVKGALIEITEHGEEDISLTFGEYEKTLGDKIADAGGGGGGDGEYYPDPLHGLHDNSDVWVPLSNDDFRIWIKLANVDGSISIVGDYATNTITFSVVPSEVCYWDRSINDAEVFTATANDDVVPNGGSGTIGQSDDYWDGVYTEQVNYSASEYVTLKDTNDLEIRAGAEIWLTIAGAASYVGTGTAFYPANDEAETCGLDNNRWSALFAVEGDFSGDVTIDTGGKGLVMSDNTLGKVLIADGDRYLPDNLSSIAGHWTVAAGEIYTTIANKDVVPNGGTGEIGQSDDLWDFGYFEKVGPTATEYMYLAAAGDIAIRGGAEVQLVVTGSNSYVADTSAWYSTNAGFDLGKANNKWDDLYLDGSIIMDALETVDGVDVSLHTHAIGGSTANTQPTLSGYTTSWDIDAWARVDGGTNRIRDFAGNAQSVMDWNAGSEPDYNEVYLRKDGGTPAWVSMLIESVAIGANAHVHHLTGNAGFGSIAATAAVSSHLHASGTLATAAP